MRRSFQQDNHLNVHPICHEYLSHAVHLKGFSKGKELNQKDGALHKIFKKLKVKNESEIIKAIDGIESSHSIGFNKSVEKLFDIPVGELFEKIREFKDTKYLLIDGILTKRLLSLSINLKIKFIACKHKEEDLIIPENLIVFYF